MVATLTVSSPSRCVKRVSVMPHVATTYLNRMTSTSIAIAISACQCPTQILSNLSGGLIGALCHTLVRQSESGGRHGVP